LERTVVSKKYNPKCPSCGIVGMDFIKEFPSNTQRKSDDPWFEIVACIKCGHVYGTLGGQ
jgi:DNA-directed RNA polymerase subunit M/transcription elongation factor TFIIS